ncbi:hypothetical protein Tco_1467020 [Tanacetum coccineum]
MVGSSIGDVDIPLFLSLRSISDRKHYDELRPDEYISIPLNESGVQGLDGCTLHTSKPISNSGTIAKKPPSVEKIIPTVLSEGTGDKPGVPDVTKDNSTESEYVSWDQESDSEQDEEYDDDNQEEEEVDQENEFEDDDIESDEDKGMDDTTDQFDDNVDAKLEEPTQTDIEVVQGDGADVEMNEAQQGNKNLETTQEQVVDDAHVTITTVAKKTEVLVTSSSRSSDLASKFLKFSDIPHTDVEIVSPLDVYVHHEVLRTQAPILLTIPVSIITESSHQLFFKALQQPFISATFDYMYIKSYSFRLFSSLPGVLTPVRGESLKILNGFDVSLPVSHSLWSSQSFGHQKAINGFDMPLPVAVCSGLVNPLAPRKAILIWLSSLVFRYLQGTINMGLWYPKDTAMALTAYADADHAGCQDTHRSTSGSA